MRKIYFVFVFIFSLRLSVSQETCFTQRGKRGICIEINECKHPQKKKLFSFFICSWESPIPKVCCLESYIHALNPPVMSPPQNHPPINFYNECGLGAQPKTFKIVNGIISKKSAWPWMAAIYRRSRSRYVFACGGSIINNGYIITAAHCFKTKSRNYGLRPELFQIRLGEYDLTDKDYGDVYKVSSIIIHSNFVPPKMYNDIAIIRLRKKIKFTDRVGPICLPNDSEDRDNLTNKLAVVIGWGHVRYAGRDSPVLREVIVPITTNDYCRSSYSSLGTLSDYPFGITKSIVCAGFPEGGKDACQNDSGGPLMINKRGKWILQGIVSNGFQCARPNFPGIYTRVTKFTDWINANIY